MRLALLPDEYLPEGTRVHAKMFHELALELKKKGHEPIVITPGKHYQKAKLTIEYYEGIEIWRFRTGQTRGVGHVKRAINESLLSFNCWRAIAPKVQLAPFDGVINYSPTIFFGMLVNKLKKNPSCKSYLILRDMFPQWVIDEGMIKENSLIAKYFRFFEHLNYRSSDCIGVMSEANLRLFQSINPQYKNVEVLRNWADTIPGSFSSSELKLRNKLSLDEKVIFFYGGNIGHAQDMANLCRLARSMKSYDSARFLFVGQGDAVELVNSLKKEWGLDNLIILPSVSQEEFKRILKQVDVGLFSLSKLHTAHNFPGKLLGYMVESLPILGSVNQGNDLIDVINRSGAGMAFVNGDDQALFDAAIQYAKSSDVRRCSGQKANKLLHECFSVEMAVSNILAFLEEKKLRADI